MSFSPEHLRSSWLSLPPNVRGVLWVSAGSLTFSLSDMVVKLLGATIHPVEMAWFRYAIGMLLLSPIFLRVGWPALRTRRLALHLGRSVIAGIGQAGIYFALVHLMLADATALSFSRPLFMTLLAVIFLGETVRRRRWAATAVGFAGVLIMMRPGQGMLDPAALAAVGSALLFSVGLILVRRLSSTESPTQILFYYHIAGITLFLGPALWLWKTPAGGEWFMLLMIGGLTCVAMVCFVRGFAIGEASILGTMEYARLVYAATIGFLVFGEVPDAWTWAGATVIIASALYMAQSAMAGRARAAR